jgi:hypothetical protein
VLRPLQHPEQSLTNEAPRHSQETLGQFLCGGLTVRLAHWPKKSQETGYHCLRMPRHSSGIVASSCLESSSPPNSSLREPQPISYAMLLHLNGRLRNAVRNAETLRSARRVAYAFGSFSFRYGGFFQASPQTIQSTTPTRS